MLRLPQLLNLIINLLPYYSVGCIHHLVCAFRHLTQVVDWSDPLQMMFEYMIRISDLYVSHVRLRRDS